MSTFTIGRFALDVENQKGLSKVSVGRGRSYNFDLVVKGADRATWRALVRQIELLSGVEEITWSTETWVNGYYRIDDVSFDLEPDARHANYFRAQVRATQLPHHRTAMIEFISEGADWTNIPGTITAQPWFAVPETALAWADADATRPCVGGEVKFHTEAGYYDHRGLWLPAPGGRYDQAVEVTLEGVPVVGQQDHADFADWTMHNHIVKLAKGTTGFFTVTFPDLSGSAPYPWGTSWQLGVGYWDTVGSGFTTLDPDDVVSVQVVEESAQRCACRMIVALGGTYPITVDVSLRRGAAHAEIIGTWPDMATTFRWCLYLPGASAGVTTQGMRSGVTEGNYRLVFVDPADTVDTVNDVIYTTSAAEKVRMAVGVSLGAGGAAPDQPSDIRDQFYAAQGIREVPSGVRL